MGTANLMGTKIFCFGLSTDSRIYGVKSPSLPNANLNMALEFPGLYTVMASVFSI